MPPSRGAGGTAFKFDASRLDRTDRMVGIGSLLLLISLFLPWFGVSLGAYGSATASGLSAHGYLYLVLLLCIAIVLDLVARAGFSEMPIKLPLPHAGVLRIATSINLLLVLIGFLFKPGGGPVGWRFGAFVGLIAAVVAASPFLLPFLQARLASKSGSSSGGVA